MNNDTIAIIGSGASGTACFLHLVLKLIINRPKKPVSILLIEKDEDVGPGLAYGTGQEGHLLNTKAGIMGLFAEEPLHFVHWMHEHQDDIKAAFPQASLHPDAYPPRTLFGNYIKDILNQYVELAKKNNIQVAIYKEEVIDAALTASGTSLFCASGKHLEANFALLATGTPESAAFSHLKDHPNYLHSPWPSDRLLQTIHNKDADVSIIGSSLTAIDAVITLIGNEHRGHIRLFSLKGLLPRVQAPSEVPFERKNLTLSAIRRLIREEVRPLRLKDLLRLFRTEVENSLGAPIDWRAYNRVGKDQLALLEDDIKQAGEGTSIFQNILYASRYDTYEIWKLLPNDQKELYAKWIKHYMDINRHAIPLENGIKIRNLMKSGQLTVVAHSDKIEWDQQHDHFLLSTSNGQQFTTDYIINAAGPATKLDDMKDLPLILKLKEKGLIIAHPAGGLVGDLNTMQARSEDNSRTSPFYAIGHLLIGMQHDINSLWFNVKQADRLTDDLIMKIS